MCVCIKWPGCVIISSTLSPWERRAGLPASTDISAFPTQRTVSLCCYRNNRTHTLTLPMQRIVLQNVQCQLTNLTTLHLVLTSKHEWTAKYRYRLRSAIAQMTLRRSHKCCVYNANTVAKSVRMADINTLCELFGSNRSTLQ